MYHMNLLHDRLYTLKIDNPEIDIEALAKAAFRIIDWIELLFIIIVATAIMVSILLTVERTKGIKHKILYYLPITVSAILIIGLSCKIISRYSQLKNQILPLNNWDINQYTLDEIRWTIRQLLGVSIVAILFGIIKAAIIKKLTHIESKNQLLPLRLTYISQITANVTPLITNIMNPLIDKIGVILFILPILFAIMNLYMILKCEPNIDEPLQDTIINSIIAGTIILIPLIVCIMIVNIISFHLEVFQVFITGLTELLNTRNY